MGRRPSPRPSKPRPSRARAGTEEPRPRFDSPLEERAYLRARRDLLERQRAALQEIQAFEQRLAVLTEVPGWKYVRRGRRVLLNALVRPQERFFAYLLLHQKALLHELRLKGERAAFRGWFRQAAFWAVMGVPFALLWFVVALQQKTYEALVRSERLFMRGVVVLPNTIQSGYQATLVELSSPEQRRSLFRAFLEETLHTPRRRAALFFLLAMFLLAGWILTEALLRTLAPDALPFKRQVDFLFAYGAATRIFFPTPVELAVLPGARVLGVPLTVFTLAVGSMVGSWVLYLIGDTANKGLSQWVGRRAWTQRAWSWVTDHASPTGYFVMGAVLCIPFAPDTFTAGFALLGLRLKWFLLTAFLATIFRLSLFLAVFAP